MPEMPDTSEIAQSWYVLTVKPQHEHVVAGALDAKGIEHFAPTYVTRRRWSDRLKALSLPLFPGYVFCRTSSESRVPVLRTSGVRGFVSFGGYPAPVPQNQMDAIMCMSRSGLPIEPLDYLHAGDRIRVIDGPLRGLDGLLLECGDCSRVVVSIEMLQRSVAVTIDRTAIQPLGDVFSAFCPPK